MLNFACECNTQRRTISRSHQPTARASRSRSLRAPLVRQHLQHPKRRLGAPRTRTRPPLLARLAAKKLRPIQLDLVPLNRTDFVNGSGARERPFAAKIAKRVPLRWAPNCPRPPPSEKNPGRGLTGALRTHERPSHYPPLVPET